MRFQLSLLLLSLIFLPACTENPKSAIDAQTLRGPITVKLENRGDFANGASWSLELDTDRKAKLAILSYPTDISRTFTVSKQQIEELRDLLVEQRFFELDSEYGQLVSSGSTQTLTVTCGDSTNSVQLHFLMNWVHDDTSRLRDPARAVRVWRLIREWFNDPEAVDLKRYDEMVLDAAPS